MWKRMGNRKKKLTFLLAEEKKSKVPWHTAGKKKKGVAGSYRIFQGGRWGQKQRSLIPSGNAKGGRAGGMGA